MSNVTTFRGKEDLTARQPITIELPRFLIRAFERQVAEANEDAADEECVTLQHFIELHLAEQLSIADVQSGERRSGDQPRRVAVAERDQRGVARRRPERGPSRPQGG